MCGLFSRHPPLVTRHPFRVGRGDQAKLRVEDAYQVVEVPRAILIPRSFEQLLAGPHLPLDVGAALGKQGFQHRLGGFLMEAMLGRGGRGAEGLFEERQTDALRAAHLFERGRGPGLPFHHLGEEGQSDRDDLPVLGQPGNRSIQEGIAIAAEIVVVFGQGPVSPPEGHQHLPGMTRIEQVHQGAVIPLEQSDLQVSHEPAGGEPEIVPHQHDGLEMLAVAVPQGGDQLRVLLAPAGVEPLLELIQDQQHLMLRRQDAAPPHVRQRIDQTQASWQFGTDLVEALEQPGFGLIQSRLDVDRQDLLAQPGQEAGLDQRRLAATRRAVDQSDLEGQVGVDPLDLPLPELDAIRQAIPVSRSGKQFQEEVGIMGVERS